MTLEPGDIIFTVWDITKIIQIMDVDSYNGLCSFRTIKPFFGIAGIHSNYPISRVNAHLMARIPGKNKLVRLLRTV
jgi:hypothetical protein